MKNLGTGILSFSEERHCKIQTNFAVVEIRKTVSGLLKVQCVISILHRNHNLSNTIPLSEEKFEKYRVQYKA